MKIAVLVLLALSVAACSTATAPLNGVTVPRSADKSELTCRRGTLFCRTDMAVSQCECGAL